MSGEAAHDARDADADLGAAVDGVLASLLADKDVAEIAAVEGGLIEVIRRGRRERLQALLEGPLFALLRERGAEEALVVFRLPAALTFVPTIREKVKGKSARLDRGATINEQF